MLASKLPRMLAATSGSKITDYWDDDAMAWLYAAQTIVSLFYYAVYLRSTATLGKAKFYSAELWHQSLQRL